MKIFDFEVKYEEVKKIFDDIKGYYDNDKLQHCMGLQIARENIELWHNEIVRFFTDMTNNYDSNEKLVKKARHDSRFSKSELRNKSKQGLSKQNHSPVYE